MKFCLPSKTFLVGEYGVLARGGALLFNTHPCFAFQEGVFFDPHRGQGGFGASSAEWLFRHLATCHEDLKQILNKRLDQKLAFKLQKKYQKTFKNEEGDQFVPLPSGVDILSQCVGRVAHIDLEKGVFQSRPWPFKGLKVIIVPTGNKVLTHEHLKKGVDLKVCQMLAQKSQKVISAFCQVQEGAFLSALEDFIQTLECQGLCCQETLGLKKWLREQFPSLLVKGCGAFGMDTLLMICRTPYFFDIKKFLKEQKFGRILITIDDLSEGLQEV